MAEMDFNFDTNFQQAVAGYLVKDKEFLIKCHTHIPASCFADPYISKIVGIIYDYYSKYHDLVKSKEELATIIRQNFYGDYATGTKHVEKMELMIATREQFRPEVIQSHMTGWLKMMTLRQGLEKNVSLFNEKKYDSLTGELSSLVHQMNNATFEGSKFVDFTDLKSRYEKMWASYDENCCTIGHDDFDELLRSGAKIQGTGRDPRKLETMTRGGLLPGQSTVLLGPTNIGKTTVVTSIIAANVMMGKYVYYCGHEQTEDELVDKCVRAIIGMQGDDLKNVIMNYDSRIRAAEMYLSRYLKYIHWIRSDNMFVEPVIAQFKLANSQLRAETGRGFDMIVDDYPGKLKSKMYTNKAWKRHEELLYVYESLVNVVREEKVHGLFPAQVNREGYKVNKEGNRMLDAGDAAGSYDLTHVVDNIITLGRTASDVANHRLKFFLAKSRSNTTNAVFVSKTNYGLSRSHGWDLSSKVFLPGTVCNDEACALYFNDQELKRDHAKKVEEDARFLAEMMSTAIPVDPIAQNPLFLNEDDGVNPQGNINVRDGFEG